MALLGKVIYSTIDIPNTKLHTKFEVSSSSSFEDIFDRMQKFQGSRYLSHAPLGKVIYAPGQHSIYEAMYQI